MPPSSSTRATPVLDPQHDIALLRYYIRLALNSTRLQASNFSKIATMARYALIHDHSPEFRMEVILVIHEFAEKYEKATQNDCKSLLAAARAVKA